MCLLFVLSLFKGVITRRQVDSCADALWWSAITISTVGYVDVYLVTIIGRIIAKFTMIFVVNTFGVLTASITRVLIKTDYQERALPRHGWG